MKTIAFITRVHPKRPGMLKICIDSVKKQTSDDYIHILYRDDKTEDGYGVIVANKVLKNIQSINARYVMVLDDDDMLIDPDFVMIFKEIVDKNNPEVVFFKGIVCDGKIFPTEQTWRKFPSRGGIASFCFAVKLEVWKKHIDKFNRRSRSGGDFFFISFCYGDTTNHLWLDRIVASTQKGRGRGMGELEHE